VASLAAPCHKKRSLSLAKAGYNEFIIEGRMLEKATGGRKWLQQILK